MKNIVFIGAPGSGKGTQSAFLIEEYGIVQISTGDILRAAVKDGSELGKVAKKCMDDGKLVADDIIIGIIKERLAQSDCKNGFILDGFPRTIAQAEALDKMLKDELNTEITNVISLEVNDDVIYERITGRRSCPDCGRAYHMTFNPPKNDTLCDADSTPLIQRSDDTKETLDKRLKVFHETTALIKPYYQSRGEVLVLDGMRDPKDIARDIKEFVG